MNRRERDELCDRVVEQFRQARTDTYREACRHVGRVMSELLQATVELKFVSMRGTPFSGATALRSDGTYIVYCANSRSWYHRLGILLHEFAHLLLGHQPAILGTHSGMRSLMPHLPGAMTRLIAGRSAHADKGEREAEELADELLERLTEQQNAQDHPEPPEIAPHVVRIAEGLAHRPVQGRHRAF